MRFGGWDRVASFGCGMQLIMLPWQYEPPVPGMYVTLCTYEPALGSWATCVDQVVREHTSSEQGYDNLFKTSVDFVNLVCNKAGAGLAQFTVAEYMAALRNASSFLQDSKAAPLNTPVRLEERPRIRTIDAVRAEFLNLDNSNDSVMWIYYYFGVLLVALMCLQLPWVRAKVLKNRLVNRIRAKFELPTIWKSAKHDQRSAWGLGGLLPTSLEGCLLAGLFLVHTYALFSNYAVDYREVLSPVSLQRLQGLANRSGILAFGLLPLTILFSMRTNAFINLSGLHYTTFLVLHRWVGRLMVIDSAIHSFAFYFHEKLTGEYEQAASQFWWLTGVVAFVVSLVILVPAAGAIRSRWYETFLYSHIALAIAFFYFCWTHVRNFGWVNWIVASCVLWGLERLYRLYLIMRNGGVIHADLSLVGDDLVVVRAPKPRRWRSHPTQFAFVYFLLPSIFWQSHPITVSDTGNHLEIVVSVKSGATKVLHDAALRHVQIPIALEGPYGHTPRLDKFEKILLIGGGSGVPGPLALARTYPKAQLVITTRGLNLLTAYRLEEWMCEGCNIEIYYTAADELSAQLSLLRKGRPDLAEMVTGLSAYRSAVVVCCGPPGLNDYVRNLTAATLNKHPEMELEYIEEFQVW